MKRFAALLLFVLFVTDTSAQALAAGSTPGSFRVTESGAAEYRIPIQVPPGIAGMEPKLALVYNSQAGNGLLGVGWNLEGLSAITRCARTMAQDGVRGAVSYDSNDRFCLDGQRLMAIDGSYGADGTEYRTERESFSKVMSYGTAGNGPAWFKVWTKSGQILEYGNTADSRIEAQGKASARVWALNKAADPKGNYFSIAYTEDNANGDFYPARIDYAGNALAGTAAANRVELVYEARPDIAPAYEGGSLVRAASRLAGIRTSMATALIGDYRLTYEQSASTFRSRLSGVAQCAGDGTCMPATLLTWPGGTTAPFAQQNWGTGGGNGYWPSWPAATSQPFQFTGDFNGDGKTDFMYWGEQGGWQALLSAGSGFAPVQNWGRGGGNGYWPSWQSPTSQPFQFTGDFNGDGRTDFMYWGEQGGWQALLSAGNGFAPVQDWGRGGGNGYWPSWTSATGQAFHFTGDFNGDGRTDFMYWGEQGGWQVLLSTGSGFAPVQSWGAGGGNGYWPSWQSPTSQPFQFTGDFNGDGKTDFMYWGEQGGWQALLSTGSGFAPVQDWGRGGGNGYWPSWQSPTSQKFQFTGDFNGDGKTDFMYWGEQGGWQALLSTGSGFAPVQDWGRGGGNGYWPSWPSATGQAFQFLGDVNGDGKTDFMYWGEQGGWQALLSTGSGFAPVQNLGAGGGNGYYWPSWQSPTGQPFQLAGDFNGDGKLDFMYWDGNWQVLSGSSSARDLLAGVAEGLGRTVAFAYKPLSDGTVYAKDGDASYPVVDLQGSMHVVASASRSDGVGGTIADRASFQYGGAKLDHGGRGFLGFRWSESTQAATGLKTRSEYRQDWPYLGMASLVRRSRSSGESLAQSASTYGCFDPASGAACTVAAGGRYFPFLAQSVETGSDLSGAALPAVTSTSQYDLYGNATSLSVSTGDGHGKTTTSTYANDPSSWRLGRLKRSTLQSISP